MRRYLKLFCWVLFSAIAFQSTAYAEIVPFSTLPRSHDGRPTGLPISGATGGVPTYARRSQPRMLIDYDTETRTATSSAVSSYWYTLNANVTRTRNFPIFVPGTFPNVPDRWIDNFITETFTVQSIRVDANIAPNGPVPVQATSARHAAFFLPVDATFTMSNLRGTYRVEGATESFETAFNIGYQVERQSNEVKVDLYPKPPGIRGFAELLPIGARFTPINPVIADVTIDGVDIHVSAHPLHFQFLIPEPASASLALFGMILCCNKLRRGRSAITS